MKTLPPDHLRVPDERARLRAHEGHARLARLRRGGGARRRRPDPLQHLLDPREGGHPAGRAPRRGQAPQDRGSRAAWWAWAAAGRSRVKERRLRAVPVRGRGVRARAGAQARRVPHERQPERPGLLRVRGLHRAPPDEARARVPGVGPDLRGLQLRLLLLHRALHARPRGLAAARGAARRGGAAGRRRRARGHAARPERLLLRPRPAARREGDLRRAARRGGRRGGHRADPLHEPASRRTSART